MKSTRSFKQKVAEVLRLRDDKQYDRALAVVEELQTIWPGNPQLYILWACLVQLQENAEHGLEEVKAALQEAIDLDKDSPAAAVELGYFLDNVKDNPQAASKVFVEAILAARRLLIDGLVGRTKALLQLNKRDEAVKCLMEAVYLAGVDSSSKMRRANGATEIEDLLKEVALNRPA
jgi:tetratricopeptide (TPR) repeat protein